MPDRDLKKLGKTGEKMACNHLKSKGYKVIAKNLRLGRIEIDIIATRKRAIYFVEVKSRRSLRAGDPLEQLPFWKQKHIIAAAKMYLMRHRLDNVEVHFSVIGITMTESGDEIEFVEDAFGEDG
jgi:putative endonuclease